MSNNFIEFIAGKRREGESCGDFINDLFFGCGTQTISHLNIHYGGELEEVEIGDVIALRNAHGNFRHFATSIGNNLFMSVMGVNSSIFITTLEQMKIAYNCIDAMKVLPYTTSNQLKI